MKTVTINGCEYKLAYNLRSLFIYEGITGKPYTGEKSLDNYFLLYAALQANNEDFCMSFDEMLDACDKNFSIFDTFAEVLEEYGKRISAYMESKKKVAAK